MVLKLRINYVINVIRCDVYLFFTNNLFPCYCFFVNYFHSVQNQHMLFWLLKDAQLACKRCSFEVLLTPFWSPIKHLLFYYLITTWFSVNCKPAFCMWFCRYLLMSYSNLCNNFSNSCLQVFEVLKWKGFQWKRMIISQIVNCLSQVFV